MTLCFSSFYYDLLSNSGPMNINSTDFTECIDSEADVKTLVSSYGGLANLLVFSGRFARANDFIYPLKDYKPEAENDNTSRSSDFTSSGLSPHAPAFTPPAGTFTLPSGDGMVATTPKRDRDWITSLWDEESVNPASFNSFSSLPSHILGDPLTTDPIRSRHSSEQTGMKLKTPHSETLSASNTSADFISAESSFTAGGSGLGSTCNGSRSVSGGGDSNSIDGSQSGDAIRDMDASNGATGDMGASGGDTNVSDITMEVLNMEHDDNGDVEDLSYNGSTSSALPLGQQNSYVGLNTQNSGMPSSTIFNGYSAPPYVTSVPVVPQTYYSLLPFQQTYVPPAQQVPPPTIKLYDAAEVQTEVAVMEDKGTNTSFDQMTDYEQKEEECRRLTERYIELEDKFTQLSNSSSVEIQALEEQLATSRITEQEKTTELTKLQQKYDKAAKKWESEKKSMADGVASAKNSAHEARFKMEEHESRAKTLETNLNTQELNHQKKISLYDEEKAELKRSLDSSKNRAIKAELELLKQRQKDTTEPVNTFLTDVRNQVDRLNTQHSIKSSTSMPISAADREQLQHALELKSRLTEIRDNLVRQFSTQRESIESNQSNMFDLPVVSAPNLQNLRNAAARIFRPTSVHATPGVPVTYNNLGSHTTLHQPYYSYNGVSSTPANNTHYTAPHTTSYPLQTVNAKRYTPPPSSNMQSQEPVPQHQAETQQPAASKKEKENASNQLVDAILQIYPQKTRQDVMGYIQTIRQRRAGKLTGMKITELKDAIVQLIEGDN